MGIKKYKYYFRKPRSEIVKDILKGLFVTGITFLAASSPYFVRNLVKNLKNLKKHKNKSINSAFYRLRKDGYLKIENKNKQIYISLTEKGRVKAGWLQIDELKIKRPKRWDGLWRMNMFDIPHKKRTHREALRGKFKELGFYKLQKSVWIYPFDCEAEVELLRDFLGLSEQELRLVITDDIGEDKIIRKIYKI